MCDVIQGGSSGRMVTILLGMQVSAWFLSLSVNSFAYVLIFSFLSSFQSVVVTFCLSNCSLHGHIAKFGG